MKCASDMSFFPMVPRGLSGDVFLHSLLREVTQEQRASRNCYPRDPFVKFYIRSYIKKGIYKTQLFTTPFPLVRSSTSNSSHEAFVQKYNSSIFVNTVYVRTSIAPTQRSLQQSRKRAILTLAVSRMSL